jgi:hypothetical protein
MVGTLNPLGFMIDYKSKTDLLASLRESIAPVVKDPKRYGGAAGAAREVNKVVQATERCLAKEADERAEEEGWDPDTRRHVALLICYCSTVIMFDGRNMVRPYDYMDFSRRVGELWERFCQHAFQRATRPLTPYAPPTYADLRDSKVKAYTDHLNMLDIPDKTSTALLSLYVEVWEMAKSSRINLQSDLHVTDGTTLHVIDFKSGFGSNEKGNKNRLLTVGSIYGEFDDAYSCTLLVRAAEGDNNNYFRMIQQSGIWQAYCGEDAYRWIHEVTGVDLASWIGTNVNWSQDFSDPMRKYLTENNLIKYLEW